MCHFGKKSFKTKVVTKNTNPTWNECVYLHLKKENIGNDMLVNWKVFDFDYRSADNILAQVDVAVQSLVEACHKPIRNHSTETKFQPAPIALELTPKIDKKGLKGTGSAVLNIQCTFLPYQG